ncbi:GATA transcription factor 1-like [Primulina huaijiensis]|uniref:GATA transcription factor 1-like n=1 Tax=Primulina huaijiensis TaxID=1492673 RepID=UPI003CC6E913
MGLLNEFEESFMIDDNFLFNFTEEGDSSTFTCGVSEPSSAKTMAFGPGTQSDAFPDPMEDLEWLMDKDAFPTLESCFGLLSDDSELNHLSPTSLLDSIKTNGDDYNNLNEDEPIIHPKGTRSNKRRRTAGYDDLPNHRCLLSNNSSAPIVQESVPLGRRCQHCLVDKTPLWRAGPMGPKTLCNACGVRYKSGRLHPEYRPACSPTFSSDLHSNSHKKVMQMRMKKHGD